MKGTWDPSNKRGLLLVCGPPSPKKSLGKCCTEPFKKMRGNKQRASTGNPKFCNTEPLHINVLRLWLIVRLTISSESGQNVFNCFKKEKKSRTGRNLAQSFLSVPDSRCWPTLLPSGPFTRHRYSLRLQSCGESNMSRVLNSSQLCSVSFQFICAVRTISKGFF